ncbi:unnamed protein product [Lampetra fluviatilis]
MRDQQLFVTSGAGCHRSRPVAALRVVGGRDAIHVHSAFTGKFAEHKGKGTYGCVVCQVPLFTSQAKYDSGSGWPSFYNIISANAVSHSKDRSHGMHRTEVTCGQCGAHLGHVFDDGPPPTGKRFCINSASLTFNPGAEEEGGAEAVEEAPVKPEL